MVGRIWIRDGPRVENHCKKNFLTVLIDNNSASKYVYSAWVWPVIHLSKNIKAKESMNNVQLAKYSSRFIFQQSYGKHILFWCMFLSC